MMEIFRYKKPIEFMKSSRLSMAISLALFIISLGLLLFKGLNFGIDFTGGTVIQVRYDVPAPIQKMREQLKTDAIFSEATITEFGSPNEVIVKVPTTSSDVTNDMGDTLAPLLKGTGNFEIRRVDIVGPKVGNELRTKGLMAMSLAILAILIYVSFRFEWRFAVASIFALVHDVVIAMGALVLFNVTVNLDILAALLTILGYSLNDTIIVFDRIREGIRTVKSTVLEEIINESVTRTLSRTTLTSLTTFFVVLTLFLYGGEIINGFSFTLMVGVIVGTYSSIFVASPILIWFKFNVANFRASEAAKEKAAREKERMRAQFEQGVV
jgi:preprotein translocase subunit SecF